MFIYLYDEADNNVQRNVGTLICEVLCFDFKGWPSPSTIQNCFQIMDSSYNTDKTKFGYDYGTPLKKVLKYYETYFIYTLV